MKIILLALAVLGLVLTIIPPILYTSSTVDLQRSQQFMTLGMILWFAGDVLRVFARRRPQ